MSKTSNKNRTSVAKTEIVKKPTRKELEQKVAYLEASLVETKTQLGLQVSTAENQIKYLKEDTAILNKRLTRKSDELMKEGQRAARFEQFICQILGMSQEYYDMATIEGFANKYRVHIFNDIKDLATKCGVKVELSREIENGTPIYKTEIDLLEDECEHAADAFAAILGSMIPGFQPVFGGVNKPGKTGPAGFPRIGILEIPMSAEGLEEARKELESILGAKK